MPGDGLLVIRVTTESWYGYHGMGSTDMMNESRRTGRDRSTKKPHASVGHVEAALLMRHWLPTPRTEGQIW